ncbi:hypothetical protein CDL12_04113 [Handroanthus impetiginosus]|uniref:Uncharacterized protein n=1 Tax=Handroanthus impetiginosus TaxID=429701 RepID=A0A2G9I066_9LAMI|nr:hypothetical protein CDL12_04113 [Handroanthus impetiginosus]
MRHLCVDPSNIDGCIHSRGLICEAYLIQEVGYFVSYYFKPDIQSRRTLSKQNEFNEAKCTTRYLNDAEFNAIKLYVLINCDDVQDFVRKKT